MRYTNRIRFGLYGVLFGLHFPIIATLHDLLHLNYPITIQNILLIQGGDPHHLIIDTAPIFLGFFAYFGGKQLDKLAQKNRELKNRYTERILAEKELHKQRVALEEAKRLAVIGEFSAGIAHEINNPLAIIAAKSQFLELQLKTLEISDTSKLEAIQKSISNIYQTVNLTSELITNLITFSSKADFNNLHLYPLKPIIDGALKISNKRCLSLGINIEFKSEDGIKLLCNPSALSQVILNLINNSIDATENSSEKWIKIETIVVGKVLKIIITDSGLGIPDEIKTKITQPFFTTKEPGKGMGIGLSISLKSVEKMKGKFYHNPSEKNTQFVIEFTDFKIS